MFSVEELRTLITRCSWGDQQALAALYQATAPTLLSLAGRILGDTALAEEAVQEGFVRAWYSSADYHPGKGEPLAWLAGIVRHRALDIQRREGRQRRRDESVASLAGIDLAASAGAGIISEEVRALLACVETLPPQQRMILLLTYFHGYSNSELSEHLTTPLGTVKSWLRRAMRSVRVCLEA